MASRIPSSPLPGSSAAPDLNFAVEEANVVEHAAVPTIAFMLRVTSPDDRPIRSLALRTMIRIAVAHRSYDEATQQRLMELFGQRSSWVNTARSLMWADTSTNVAGFEGSTLVELPIVCTYDFEVTAAKYLHSLHEGAIPLEFLFSGTVFYEEDALLRAAQISWNAEASFSLPVERWRALIDRYFPSSAWLRVQRDVFDRLYAYRAARSLGTWENALEELLAKGEEA